MASAFSRIINPSPTMAPPTARDLRYNELALALFVLALLTAGWLLRGVARDDQRTAMLGDSLPTIVYPAGWALATPGDTVIFAVRDPASTSAFDSVIRVEALPILEGDVLETLRLATSLRRSQELNFYRELRAEDVLIGGGEATGGSAGAPAKLVTYAYIADPTRESGAADLPVVVEAQDLLLRAGNQWLIVTTAADATRYEAESAPFATLHDHLRVRPPEANSTLTNSELTDNLEFSSEGMEP